MLPATDGGGKAGQTVKNVNTATEAASSVPNKVGTGAGTGTDKSSSSWMKTLFTPKTDGSTGATTPDISGSGTGTGTKSSGGSGGSGGGGGGSSAPSYDENTKLDVQSTPNMTADQRKQLSADLNPESDKAAIDRVKYYDKQPMVDMATQQIELARQQYNQQIDNSMNTNAAELNRAVADAQSEYQTQRNQITANEMNSLDNAALYAEARGDKGGIGQAQYNTVQNTAAQNRASVSQAQTKLATDTARQIADLRAQGEFDKADKALELAQTYLSELRQIEEYAADYNLNVDQINTAISEWEYEYNQASQQFATNTELSIAQLTGMFNNGMSTKDAYDTLNSNMAQMALSLLEAGVEPTKLSTQQLSALAEVYGMDQTSINNYYKKVSGR